MIEPPKTKEEFLKNCTHEELEIFVLNHERSEKELRKRLFLLSGCGDYGRHDPMNGSCVDCYYEHRDLFERCCAFEDMVSSYDKAEKRRKDKEKIKEFPVNIEEEVEKYKKTLEFMDKIIP